MSVETHPIRTDHDVVAVRRLVRSRAMELALSLVEQTKVVTAANGIRSRSDRL